MGTVGSCIMWWKMRNTRLPMKLVLNTRSLKMMISEMKNGDPYPIEDWQKTAADYAMYMPNDQKKCESK